MSSRKKLPKPNLNLQGKRVVGNEDKKTMHSVQRAKVLAFETPSKLVAESILAAQKRVKEYAAKTTIPEPKHQVLKAGNFNSKTAGAHPKAMEAQKRLHMGKIQDAKMKAQQLKELCRQNNALRAAKLELLMKPHPTKFQDPLSQEERRRVEKILADEKGLLAQRRF